MQLSASLHHKRYVKDSSMTATTISARLAPLHTRSAAKETALTASLGSADP